MADNVTMVPLIRAILPTEFETVLDVGCGQSKPEWLVDTEISKHEHFGHDLLLSIFPEKKITGIDAHQSSIDFRNKFGPPGNYILADVSKTSLLGLVSGPFDVILCNHAIEHFPKATGWDVLKAFDFLATKMVIIGCPKGYTFQGDNFPFMEHLSGWDIVEFLDLGYELFYEDYHSLAVYKRFKPL